MTTYVQQQVPNPEPKVTFTIQGFQVGMERQTKPTTGQLYPPPDPD
jgi:hypothetical protein